MAFIHRPPATGHWPLTTKAKVFGLLSATYRAAYHFLMPLEFARLLLGLTIAACHRRIADFILERERSLVLVFRQRGLPLPAAMSTETAHNLYFGVGIFVVLVELLRIYQIAR